MDLIQTISDTSKQIVRTVDNNSPTILTSLAVAGLLGTAIFAVRDTLAAIKEIDRAEHNIIEHGDPDALLPLEPKDIVAVAWKCYIPTAIMGSLTIACMIGSNHISLQRNAAIASLYTIAERGLREYQAKVIEHVGEKKAEKIREEIAEDHMKAAYKTDQTIILTGSGSYLVFDMYSKRYFRAHVNAVEKAVNVFNQKLNREGYLSINEFYDLLGLEDITLGEEQGWIATNSLLEPKLYSKLHPETREPCLVLDYYVQPKHI